MELEQQSCACFDDMKTARGMRSTISDLNPEEVVAGNVVAVYVQELEVRIEEKQQ